MSDDGRNTSERLLAQAKDTAARQAALEIVSVYLLAHMARLEGKGVVGLRRMTAELIGFADGMADISNPAFTQTIERVCSAAEDILRERP